MKSTNLKVWTDALRSGDFGQTNGHLADPEGYCCLGVGECVRWGGDPGHLFAALANQSFPPTAFHEWLGLPRSRDSRADVYLDLPLANELFIGDGTMNGEERGIIAQGTPGSGPVLLDKQDLSCANLNDAHGLTFDQIADMLDYFGVAS